MFIDCVHEWLLCNKWTQMGQLQTYLFAMVPLPGDSKSGCGPSSSLLPVPLRLVLRIFSPLNPSLDEKAISPGSCAAAGIKS